MNKHQTAPISSVVEGLRKRLPEIFTHTMGTGGNCVFCGKYANQHEDCLKSTRYWRKVLRSQIRGGRALLKHLRQLPREEWKDVSEFLTRSIQVK